MVDLKKRMNKIMTCLRHGTSCIFSVNLIPSYDLATPLPMPCQYQPHSLWGRSRSATPHALRNHSTLKCDFEISKYISKKLQTPHPPSPKKASGHIAPSADFTKR